MTELETLLDKPLHERRAERFRDRLIAQFPKKYPNYSVLVIDETASIINTAGDDGFITFMRSWPSLFSRKDVVRSIRDKRADADRMDALSANLWIMEVHVFEKEHKLIPASRELVETEIERLVGEVCASAEEEGGRCEYGVDMVKEDLDWNTGFGWYSKVYFPADVKLAYL